MRYLGREYLLIVSTSSSEVALPRLIAKMEHLGVSKPVVGITVPTGYSFNLDGTAIYLTMASLFIANAMGTPLSVGEQISLLLFMMIASKGAAGVTGAGIATLAGGLQAHRPDLVDGVGVIVGIDRFMSEARALTNFTGNAVATLLVGTWTPRGRQGPGRARARRPVALRRVDDERRRPRRRGPRGRHGGRCRGGGGRDHGTGARRPHLDRHRADDRRRRRAGLAPLRRGAPRAVAVAAAKHPAVDDAPRDHGVHRPLRGGRGGREARDGSVVVVRGRVPVHRCSPSVQAPRTDAATWATASSTAIRRPSASSRSLSCTHAVMPRRAPT